MAANVSGGSNVGVGVSAFGFGKGNNNTAIGRNAGYNVGFGNQNVYIGCGAGPTPGSGGSLVTESYRLYISASLLTGGNPSGAVTPLIYGEFDNKKLRFNVDDNTASAFDSRVEVNGRTGESGLRLVNLTSGATPGTNPGSGVLSVNANGDVILVNDVANTGITNSCTGSSNVGFIPKTSDTSGNLNCSSIFDDGAGHVGFGFGNTPNTAVNVSINGSSATYGGTYNVSDKKFKKDIKPINDALGKIMELEGKTYNWKKAEYKDIKFSDDLQYGLIAQEVQQVIPSLVLQSDNGDLAMNYIGLIPVLIEAMKQQQQQIEELKNQIADNFKAQNGELIQLSNTKIISVSPNPSNDKITISLNIEPSVQQAKLFVHDINGNVVGTFNINERENNISKTLHRDNFGKGIYIVSLLVNGKSIDTKKIVFN